MRSHFYIHDRPGRVPAIVFEHCVSGWIDCRLTHSSGGVEQAHVLRCSHVYDPLPDFIAWLEAITREADEASWTVNQEGSFARLRAVRFGGDAVNLFCEDKTNDPNVTLWSPRLNVLVFTIELVRAAYWALGTFVSSPAFSLPHWSTMNWYEHWMHRYPEDGRISLDTLATNLAAWSRDQILAALFHALPAFDTHGQPELPTIAPAWDSFPSAARESALRSLLAELTNSFGGSDPRTLPSPVIESWLAARTRWH
jgi:hypothetical protein